MPSAPPPPPEWLAARFGEYYASARPTLPKVERREFGFGGWEKKIEFRHLAFASESALWARLRQDRPLYVSASSAYYESPGARPMARKNWLGADLVFDLDAPAHSCAPFTCPDCLQAIRHKALTLVDDYLLPDFGLSPSELHLNFSGSRGYHVRVHKKELEPLGREERHEIVDYIEGVGLNFDDLVREEPLPGTPMRRLSGPTPSAGGYPGKYAKAMVKMAQDASRCAAISPKLKKAEAAARFIAGIEAGNWSAVPIPKARETLRAIFEKTRLTLYERVGTDANVTIDTAKILRLPDSLHGGSGLMAKTMPYPQLAGYEPYRDALAFSMHKTEKVKLLRDVPSLEFAGATQEAQKKDACVSLPQAYAVFLVCKKAATPHIND